MLEFPLEFQVFGDSADVDAEAARGDTLARSLEAGEEEVEDQGEHFLLPYTDSAGRASVPHPSTAKGGAPGQ